MLHEAEHNFAEMGLKGKSPSVDWDAMQAYKAKTIGQNTQGIEFLFKKNKIDWLKGWGSIPEAGKVRVGDEVRLDPANLYRSLRRMRRDGIVEEAESDDDAPADQRRVFALTQLGRAVVRAEAARLARLAEVAREVDLLPTRNPG